MKNKTLKPVLICLLIFLNFAGFTFAEPTLLSDGANLLTAEEKGALQQKLTKISSEYNVNVAVVTTNTLDGKPLNQYAEDYFDEIELGDGVMLLVSMEDDDCYIVTGGYGITAVPNEKLEYVFDKILPPLGDGDYAKSFDAYADVCSELIKKAKTNIPLLSDQANLLTKEEKEALQQKLTKISSENKVNVAIATVDTLEGKTAMNYADDYFDKIGLGDGALLLISMEDRDWYISTGGYGITAFTDEGLKYISNKFLPYLKDDDYAKAFDTYAELCSEFIAKAKAGTPYDKGNMPKPPYPVLFIPAAIAIGIGGGFLRAGAAKRALKSVEVQESAASYERDDSMNLTGSDDIFLYNTVDSVEIVEDTSSGSSTHTSSSGETHGGTGGKF